MDLTLTIITLAISFILILGGLYIRNSYLNLSGFFLVLLLGILLVSSPLKYPIGEQTNTIYEYGNNFSGYHWDYTGTEPNFNSSTLNDPSTVFLFHTTENKTLIYTTDTTLLDYSLSFVLLLTGLFGVLWSVRDLTNDHDNYMNDHENE